MPTLNECKYTALLANTGETSGTLSGLEWLWLSQQTGRTDLTLNGQWVELLTSLGYTGTLNEMQIKSWQDQGWVGGKWNELAHQFWCTGGGSYGPSVTIQRNNDPGFCEFEPPTTTECAASETYTANDLNFTNPANTWLWSIEPPVVGVTLSDATLKTCTVDTALADTDVQFNLKVVATDSVSTDTADRTTTFTQDHIDANVAPAYIGPNINSREYTVDVPITPVETFNLFTGTNLFFELAPTLSWPTGLQIDSATGQITGTPTGALGAYKNLRVKVSNSKGEAFSTQFTITLVAGSVAPLFDNGPVPDQSWPIDQAIAQFPMGQYFVTGTFPRTYTIESGSLPSGLTMNTAGQINGTPDTDDETGSIVVRCTNAAGFALTNEWNWLTFDAIEFNGPIPAQSATVGVEYSHDYSQYFTGDVSDYLINTASWPPGTIFDTNTGIATFTPAVTFSGTNALVIANSIYDPPFLISNNFAWTVLDEPITNVVITEDQAGACTYEPGPVLTAVSLGTPGDTTVANYYTSNEGLINTDYTEMTLVFSFYGHTLYGSTGTGKNVFGVTNNEFGVGYQSNTGGWRTFLKRVTNTNVNLDYGVSPGAMALNAWHAAMFTISSAGAWSLWVDGASVASGNIGAQTFYAHNRIGASFIGKNPTTSTGQPCYLSHVWCHNVYYDPTVYWQEFFDAQNYPKDLGADGSVPTGVQPLSYFKNGDPTDNTGTLANWTEVGTVPQAPTSPSD